MNEKFKLIIVQNQIRRIYILCFFMSILQAAVLLTFMNQLPAEIPLFYSLTWGAQQLAPVYFLFIFPSLSFILILINLFSSIIFFDLEIKDYFLAKLLAFFTLILSLISAYGLMRIIILFI